MLCTQASVAAPSGIQASSELHDLRCENLCNNTHFAILYINLACAHYIFTLTLVAGKLFNVKSKSN